MLTLDAVKQYLGADYDDEVITANVKRAMATAKKTLEGAVGADLWEFLPGDERAEELILIYTDDLYSNRGVSAKVSGATRRMVADMELQLRLELARLREAAQA